MAARLGCFMQGFAISCWAPMIPIIENALSLGTSKITFIILGFGTGSVAGMLLAGFFTARLGPKIVYAVSSSAIAITICLISQLYSFVPVLTLAVLFGMSVGALDVWGSIYGALLEKNFNIKVLGPLYALFSLGELTGAGIIVFMLFLKFEISLTVPALFAPILLCALWYAPCIEKKLNSSVNSTTERRDKFHFLPKGQVIPLSFIVACIFMTGGAVIDWSGLYLTKDADAPLNLAASGYILLSSAMFVSRSFSNKLAKVLGEYFMVWGGCLTTALGLAGVLLSPDYLTALVFFAITGFGMGNVSPLCVRACTRQKSMPLAASVTTLSVIGYTALLLGPALLGYTANFIGLYGVFLVLTLFCALGTITAKMCRILFCP